jgi:CheY-like chemotaxis protein
MNCEAMTLRCLIVDDSPGFARAASSLLERQDIEVVGVASTSAEALRRAAESRPDVILLDIDLGGESGFEVAERLHRRSTGVVPVILISTHAEEDYADLIASSSVVGFLPKVDLSGNAVRDVLRAYPGAGPQPPDNQ